MPNHSELLSQIGKLKVTQLPSGELRVEGRRDDLADAAVLAIEYAVEKLGPTGGDVVCETRLGWWDGRQLCGFQRLWKRRLPNGEFVPCEPPIGSREFEENASELLAQGISTPQIERWLRDRAKARGADPETALARALNAPIIH